MNRTVFDEHERVGRWVCERIGGEFQPQTDKAIGLERDGELVAGVVFDNYVGRSMCIHVAGDGGHWLTRAFLREVFGYVFDQAKVLKLIGPVDSTNAAARRFDEHLGFVLEATLSGASKNGDLLLMTMTREQCRWLHI